MDHEIRTAIVEHGEYVASVLADTPPQHGAILPSEMFAFCCLALDRGVGTVIESGRRYGHSTDVLSRFPWNVVSIDVEPNAECDARLVDRENLTLLRADGVRWVRSQTPDGPAALLLDGPKGLLALDLSRQVRDRYCLIAIHDAFRGTQLREAVQDTAYLTDNEWLLKTYGHLDAAMLEYRGYRSHGDLLSEGSVLAILK